MSGKSFILIYTLSYIFSDINQLEVFVLYVSMKKISNPPKDV